MKKKKRIIFNQTTNKTYGDQIKSQNKKAMISLKNWNFNGIQ